ncbi:MAG: NAD(P)/FAD-dependent oxidoreductase [Betaproteobacteria bacterium]|nr:NAD(P)/FAD-dependent oxidoreductase [Betaproteobacteria bacterium]
MDEQTRYLVVGASHAGLEALRAIRLADQEGSLTLATRDASLPYSPTVLPYVVSGRSDPERVFLRDGGFFEAQGVCYLSGARLAHLDCGDNRAVFASGARIRYEKLLLATGASPVVPPIPGLDQVPFHVLRTLSDAVRLRAALQGAKQAVVLGAGLIGMHAAENLAKAGARVTVIEMQSQVLPGYFDAEPASLIQKAFADHGVHVLTGMRVLAARQRDGACAVTIAGGETLKADLLLVSTGVEPEIAYLNGCPVEMDRGILVDDAMLTSVSNVWAAGDVAQARGFFSNGTKVLNAILPDAAEQGRIAGMAMAGDPAARFYRGGVPLNTYHFFGQHAVSVGVSGEGEDHEVHQEFDARHGRYLKIVIKDNRLQGIFGINVALDGGIMWELILRGVDLGPVKGEFITRPQETGRVLMSRIWR